MKTRIVKRNESGKKLNGLLVLALAVSFAVSPVPVWAGNENRSTNPAGAIATKPVVKQGTTRTQAPVLRGQAPAPLVTTRDFEPTTVLPFQKAVDAIKNFASTRITAGSPSGYKAVKESGVKILSMTDAGQTDPDPDTGEVFNKFDVLYAVSQPIPNTDKKAKTVYQTMVFKETIYQSTEDDSYGFLTPPAQLTVASEAETMQGLLSTKLGIDINDVEIVNVKPTTSKTKRTFRVTYREPSKSTNQYMDVTAKNQQLIMSHTTPGRWIPGHYANLTRGTRTWVSGYYSDSQTSYKQVGYSGWWIDYKCPGLTLFSPPPRPPSGPPPSSGGTGGGPGPHPRR